VPLTHRALPQVERRKVGAEIPARIDVKNALRSFVIDSIGPDAFDNFTADEVIE
jgi:hypothetical protein